MKPLIKDKGLEQYPSVRDAYDSAKEILKEENPDRKELSDLLGILEKNPEGVVWLKLEEGENYNAFCSGMEKWFFSHALGDIAGTAKKGDMKDAVIMFYNMCNAFGYGTKQFQGALKESAKNVKEQRSLYALRGFMKTMIGMLEPPTQDESDTNVPKAYLYEKVVAEERLWELGTYNERDTLRRIVFPSESCWILRNPSKEGEPVYVSPLNTGHEHIETLVEGFKDFEKADGLNGEWLRIDEIRKISAISSEESQKIFAYAEFRRGRIEGNYGHYMGVQKEIETMLGISNKPIISPSIPAP